MTRQAMLTDGLSNSPARRLPPELTAEIFKYCVGAINCNSNDRSKMDMITPKAPLLLIQICSVWRELALSTPSLWTNITLNISKDGNKRIRQFLHLVKRWLVRSKTHPFTLVLMGCGDCPDPECVMELLDILEPHAFHWKSISLRDFLITNSAIQRLFKLISIGAPMLKILDISGVDTGEFGEGFGNFEIDLSSSPQLTEFNVHPSILCACIMKEPEQILRLTVLKAIPLSMFLNFLILFRSLEYFQVQVSLLYLSLDAVPPLECCLRTFHLTIRSLLDGVVVLKTIRLPLLQELSLDYRGPRRNSVMSNLVELLTRSGCVLKKLSLDYHFSPIDSGLSSVLKLTPALECLVMKGHIDEEIIESLTIENDTRKTICPILETLSMTFTNDMLSGYMALQNMVLSRSGSTKRNLARNQHIPSVYEYGTSIFLYGLGDLSQHPETLECFLDCNVQCFSE